MFKNNYKKANEALNPSQAVLQNVKAAIEAAETGKNAAKSKKAEILNFFNVKRVAAAAAAVAVIAVTAFTVINNRDIIKPPTKSDDNIASSASLQSGVNDKNGEFSKGNKGTDASSKSSPRAVERIKQNNYLSGFVEVKSFDSLYKTFKGLRENSVMVDGDASYTTPETKSVNDSNTGVKSGSSNVGKSETGSTDNINGNRADGSDYSKTNTQVDGVDEADIVKTDGKYIYAVSTKYENSVFVYTAAGKDSKRINIIRLNNTNQLKVGNISEMYLANGRLTVISEVYDDIEYGENGNAIVCKAFPTGCYTRADIINVENPKSPKLISTFAQDGSCLTTRLADGKLYIISNKYNYNDKDIEKNKHSTFAPKVVRNGKESVISYSNILVPKDVEDMRYAVACSYDTESGTAISEKALLGGSDNIYMNEQYLILTSNCALDEKANNKVNKIRLTLFSVNGGRLKEKSSGIVNGYIDDQFSLDIYNNTVRVVTTTVTYKAKKMYAETSTTNGLYIFDTNMQQLGKVDNLAKDERVYSARFMGNIGYFVTYRETDPLFAVDLTNPKKPKVLSALKIDGFSSYLHPYSNGKLLGLGEIDNKLKLTMFNISDPSDVKELTTKKITSSYAYAPAEYDHKALFVDVQKNRFGFAYEDYSENDDVCKLYYVVYKYNDKDNEFKRIEKIEIPRAKGVYTESVRGLYSDEYFYVFTGASLKVYNFSDYSFLKEIV